MPNTDIPDPTWTTTAPGRMELPPTGYAITWDGIGLFVVEWNGKSIGAAGSLDGAKGHASWHMKSLLTMGLDP